jgi:hypothetical protein
LQLIEVVAGYDCRGGGDHAGVWRYDDGCTGINLDRRGNHNDRGRAESDDGKADRLGIGLRRSEGPQQ